MTQPVDHPLDRAVVIGASIAGLASAAALAPRARSVVLVERRPLPPSGAETSIAPQGQLAHVLLAGGAASLERLVPGITMDLIGRGSVIPDLADPRCRWWAAGAVRRTIPDLGVVMSMCSRALVETVLRERVLALGNVEVLDGVVVRGLDVDRGRVRAVTAERDGEPVTIGADLVVDASGRGSRAPAWLETAGYDAPPVTRVEVDVTYCGLEVRRHPDDLDRATFAVIQNGRGLSRIGVALPAEGDRWKLILGGYFGDAAPLDRAGLEAFAASLPDPALSELLRNEWLTEPIHHRFPSSQRRHWEKVRRLPAGFAVIGDGVASFNPIYGQGMSSAAQQAEVLGACVDRHGVGPSSSRAIAKATAKVVANPWRVATGADFIYPETVGSKAPGTDLVNRYLDRVFVAAASDEVVHVALARVQHLLAPPATLFRPGVVQRVLRRSGTVGAAAPAADRAGRVPSSAARPR
jgi:2-polyprenyl-6-methoxyphenol hydroxylase-like FAD-dependent oxidoreductase